MKFANEEEMQRAIKATIKYVLAVRERRGEGCPAIMTIDATGDSENFPVYCSETFAEFEHDALMNNDQRAVEEVRSAMAARPRRLIVYTMTETRTMVSVAHKNVAEMERTIAEEKRARERA
jgi:hypothetical protein